MSNKYTLDGKKPIECEDLMTWAKWFATANRHVALDERDGVRVSTVFLGLDHRFVGDGPPILFETMIFGGPHDEDCERYATWEAAEAGHAEMCTRAFPSPQNAQGQTSSEARWFAPLCWVLEVEMKRRIYEVALGVFGDKGWHRVSFWRWLWMRSIYVTRVRIDAPNNSITGARLRVP